jgi:hypothetical protein
LADEGNLSVDVLRVFASVRLAVSQDIEVNKNARDLSKESDAVVCVVTRKR